MHNSQLLIIGKVYPKMRDNTLSDIVSLMRFVDGMRS